MENSKGQLNHLCLTNSAMTTGNMFQGVEGDEVKHARAERQGHEFGDVDRKISETRHGREHGFERDDGDERDQDLRTCS